MIWFAVPGSTKGIDRSRRGPAGPYTQTSAVVGSSVHRRNAVPMFQFVFQFVLADPSHHWMWTFHPFSKDSTAIRQRWVSSSSVHNLAHR